MSPWYFRGVISEAKRHIWNGTLIMNKLILPLCDLYTVLYSSFVKLISLINLQYQLIIFIINIA